MRASTRRPLTALLALLLVSTAAAPVGTAAAQTENTCSDAEKAAIALSLGYGGLVNDCNNIDTDGNVDESLEKDELQTELYTYASGVEGQRSVFSDTLDNYLNDTETSARIEAQNAYVDALENNSDLTKSEAKIEAQQAVEEYYATKQKQLINQWEVGVESVRYAGRVAYEDNTTASPDDIIDVGIFEGGSYRDHLDQQDWKWEIFKKDISGEDFTRTVSLVNGEEVTYETLNFLVGDGYPDQPLKVNRYMKTDTTNVSDAEDSQMFHDVEILAPASLESDNVRMLEQDRYVNRWTQITDQEQQITSEIGDLVEGTYTAVQNGEIASEDLVDPYMGAREYDPENETLGTSWAMRTIMSLGLAPPENLESMGNMTVRNETSGETHTGMLMSDSAPPNSDGFTVGETYDAETIPGSQMVAGSDGSHHSLTTNFTLVSATGTNGTEFGDGTTIGYGSSPTYSATNLTEWKEQMSAATNRTVEIEVRKQRLTANNSAGGGGLLDGANNLIPGLKGIQTAIALVVALVVSLMLIGLATRS